MLINIFKLDNKYRSFTLPLYNKPFIMKKKEPMLLFDQLNKVYVKIVIGKDKKWERWVSDTKKSWVMTHNSLSLDDVMRMREEVVSNNYNNLYSLILHKK